MVIFKAIYTKHHYYYYTTTAADFDRWFLNPQSISNNITIITLNTDFMKSHNYRQYGLGQDLGTTTTTIPIRN